MSEQSDSPFPLADEAASNPFAGISKPAREKLAKRLNCAARVALDAAADVVAAVGPAVLDELRQPDGVVHIPPVIVSACDPLEVR